MIEFGDFDGFEKEQPKVLVLEPKQIHAHFQRIHTKKKKISKH